MRKKPTVKEALVILSMGTILGMAAFALADSRPNFVVGVSAVQIGQKASRVTVDRLAAELETAIGSQEGRSTSSGPGGRVVSGRFWLEPIEPPAAVVSRLANVIVPNLLRQSASEAEVLATVDPRDKRIIRVTAHSDASSTKEIVRLLTSTVEALVGDHRTMLDNHLTLAAAQGESTVERLQTVSQPTRAIWSTGVTKRSQRPSNTVVVLIGFIGGLTLGLAGVLVRRARAEAAVERPGT
jgi:hypothetical protein